MIDPFVVGVWCEQELVHQAMHEVYSEAVQSTEKYLTADPNSVVHAIVYRVEGDISGEVGIEFTDDANKPALQVIKAGGTPLPNRVTTEWSAMRYLEGDSVIAIVTRPRHTPTCEV